MSYAEIKALCAGDSRIKEKMDLEIDVARLKVLKADFQSQHYRMEDQLLKYFPQEIAKIQGILACLQADMKTAAEHPHPEDGFAGITIKGTAFTDKEKAGAALMEAVKEATNCDPVKIGTYRGFTLLVTLENFGKDYVLNMMGEVSHKVTLGNDPKGNIVRMENSLNDMDRLMKTGEAQIQNLHEQMDHAKAELGKTFPQEAELAEKQARLADLTAELNLDEHSKESQTKEKDSAPKRKPSVLERLKQPLPPSSTPSTKKDERRNDLDR